MDRFVKRVKLTNSRDEPSAAQKACDWPNKRPRRGEIKDSEDGDEEDLASPSDDDTSGGAQRDKAVDSQAGDEHQTDFENTLPAVATDQEAIEEYEALRASQTSAGDDSVAARIDNRQWIRGRSSIYVDAFNLALDTVLQDEDHLFDDKEKCVFEEWRALTYEAQYLLVSHRASSSAV
jgi:Fanconi-associated nuclease 1